MQPNLVNNPNSSSFKLLNELNSLSKQQSHYSIYDNKAPEFKSSSQNMIEPFFMLNNEYGYMFRKLIIILIILILAFFTMKFLDFV